MAGRYTLPTDNSAGFKYPAKGLIVLGNASWNGSTATITAQMGWTSQWSYSIKQGASKTIFTIRAEVWRGATRVWNHTYGVSAGAFPAYFEFLTGDYFPSARNPGAGVVVMNSLPAGTLKLFPVCSCDTPQIDGGGSGTFSYGEGYRVPTINIDVGTLVPPQPDQLIVTQNAVGEHDVTFTHNLRRAGMDYRDAEFTVGVWDQDANAWLIKDVGDYANNKKYANLRHDWKYTYQFRCYRVSNGSELTALRQTKVFTTLIDTAECYIFTDKGWTMGEMYRCPNPGQPMEKSKITYVETVTGMKPNLNNLDKY